MVIYVLFCVKSKLVKKKNEVGTEFIKGQRNFNSVWSRVKKNK